MAPTPLIHRQDIQRRVVELGLGISRDYADRPPLALALMDGAFCFAADLARAITIPELTLAFHRVRSYRGTQSTGTVEAEPLPDVAGRHVLVIDDILDSGRTMAAVVAAASRAGAASVAACVLLDKPSRRDPAAAASARYIGFTIPDRFVVGYGLDLDGRWRHLPDVCTVD